MGTQHLTECLIEQVGTRVVRLRSTTLVYIHACHEFCFGLLWQLINNVDAEVVLFLHIEHVDRFVFIDEHTLVTHFTTHFCIERSRVEYHFVSSALLCLHLAVFQDVASIFCIVIAYELALTFSKNHPVASLHLCSIASTVLLLLHFGIETCLIDCHAFLTTDQFCEVEREAECIEECESLVASDFSLTSCLGLFHHATEQLDTVFECAKERILFFLHHLHDEVFLCRKFWEGISHLVDERRHKFVDECLLLSKERVAIADCTTKDSTNHVSCLGIAWQLTISNGESNGTQVVCYHSHGNIRLFLCTIFDAAHITEHLDDWLEHVCVIIGMLALQGTNQTFEAHTCVNHIHGKLFQTTICLAIELHEDEVPDFYHLWVILIHEFTSRHLCLFLRRTGVEVDFRTRATRTCISHFPEIVVLVTIDDVVGRHVLQPELSSLVVALDVFFWRALKHRHIKVIWIELEHIHEIFPSHIDGTFLEIVTKRPVAEHLKHGVVVSVMTDFFQVVVLTAYTQTLLRVSTATRLWVCCT